MDDTDPVDPDSIDSDPIGPIDVGGPAGAVGAAGSLDQVGRVVLVSAHDTWVWGERLGRLLRAGDLVLLTGELGAGKTTLTQGIGRGLGVREPITSPTFVIARVHPSLVCGPELVHVDAYRLSGFAELDDLDLDTTFEDAVTVVEWGHGLAEDLGDSLLELTLAGTGHRTVTVATHGDRWQTPDARRSLDELVSLA